MGLRGPVGKRIGDRLGHVTKAEKAAVSQVDVSGAVKVPPASQTWHPIARDWYRSLKDSGQSRYFEPSDWQAARLVAHEMTRMLSMPMTDGPTLGKLWAAMGDLLTTEASRRRVKIEINRKPLSAVPAPVAQIDDFRSL